MKNFLKLIHKIIFGICILVLLLAGVIALTSKFNLPGGFRIYSVLTGSMEPNVPTGSLIISKIPFSTEEIKQGDVITFIEPGFRNKFVTHRVYQVIKHGNIRLFQTKGDANKSPDSWKIAYGSIKGVYQIDFPYLGYFLEFLKSPLGIVIFVFIPLAIIAASEIRNIFNILFEMRVQKERVRQEDTRSTNLLLIVLSFILGLSLFVWNSSSSFALFSSAPVTIQGSIIATAKSFPTPSPTPCPNQNNTTITISGNGAESTNTVNITNSNNTTITQTNNATTINSITSITNIGNNTNTNNTGGNNTIISSSAASIANIFTQTGSNSAMIK